MMPESPVTVAAVESAREDNRARGAIERLTERWLPEAKPGVTRSDLRSFVVNVAKRNDEIRPLNTLDPASITRTQARHLVRDAIEAATLINPRVQAAITRFARKVRQEYPDLDIATSRMYATNRLLPAFLSTPPMLDLALSLFANVMAAKVRAVDARQAVDQLLAPDSVTNALAGTTTIRPTINVDVETALDLHPAAMSA